MATDLYAVLEIEPEASPEEIKRAYYRQVRKHPPETDPEKFKAIRAAYETLSNPKAREQYDAVRCRDEINSFFSKAEEYIASKDWGDAIPLLKTVLILEPNAGAARNQLGLCYLHLEQYDNAIKQFQTLTSQFSDVAVCWYNLGMAHKEKAGSTPHDFPSRIRDTFATARECFQKAISLDSVNTGPYLRISETYLCEKNFLEALEWAEKAKRRRDDQEVNRLYEHCKSLYKKRRSGVFEATVVIVVGVIGAVIGALIFGFWGAIIGFWIGCLIAKQAQN